MTNLIDMTDLFDVDTTRPSISLTVPYPPSCNRVTRHGNGHAYVPKEVKEFRAAVVKAGEECRIVPISGPVAVTYKVFRPRRAGDLMNREKALSDALNGIAWTDDKQIVEAHLFRFDDASNPRVEIVVEGVFRVETAAIKKRKPAVKSATVKKAKAA